MTKRKKSKPASKSSEKKVQAEPVVEKSIEDVILEAAEDGVITTEEVQEIKEAKEKVEEVIEEVFEEAPEVDNKREFPDEETVCTHPHTKRIVDRRMRALHVCTNPKCNKVIRIGGR